MLYSWINCSHEHISQGVLRLRTQILSHPHSPHETCPPNAPCGFGVRCVTITSYEREITIHENPGLPTGVFDFHILIQSQHLVLYKSPN